MSRFQKKRLQNNKKVLLVDDDIIFCKYLQKHFIANEYLLTCLTEGEALPKLLNRKHQAIDMIILDIELPGRDGFYWLKWLKEYHPYIPVILISSQNMQEQRLYGLRNGARDYVIKPFFGEELLIRLNNTLKSVLHSQNPITPNSDDFTIDTKNQCFSKDGKLASLTPLETKILQLLHLNIGKPVSREEIANQIWGIEYNPMGRNIDIHISQLRKKLKDNPVKPEYIKTVRGRGYSLNLPLESTAIAI